MSTILEEKVELQPAPTEALTLPQVPLGASPDYDQKGVLKGLSISGPRDYTATVYVEFFNSNGSKIGDSQTESFTTGDDGRFYLTLKQRSGAARVTVDLPGVQEQSFPIRRR